MANVVRALGPTMLAFYEKCASMRPEDLEEVRALTEVFEAKSASWKEFEGGLVLSCYWPVACFESNEAGALALRPEGPQGCAGSFLNVH